jgi:hypothetical protein
MSDPASRGPSGPPAIPDDVRAMADERALARAGKDWATADRLRVDLEARGWRVVDQGLSYRLEPAHAPDVEEGDVVRYGRSESVPSRLAEPSSRPATVVLLATDWPDDLDRCLTALARHAAPDTQVVIVADDPSPEQAAALDIVELGGPLAVEIVLTATRLGHAAATNAGIRRAAGEVVILLDTSLEPDGDFVTPLREALADPTVAVAGGWGIVSADLRRFEDAPPGDVDAIEGYCQAFRRSDAAERGPLDERFRFYRNLDIWWSLVLRDAGPDQPPRRALRLALPLARHEHRGYASVPEDERERLSRRNFYRILDRFRMRTDLLLVNRRA